MENVESAYAKTISSGTKKRVARVGTLLGVYLPTLLTMIGVCLYLRLSFVIGNGGLTQTICVFSFGLFVTILTAFSIASTASNMKIGEGGTYFMISRSFGLEIGAATGIALYLAHTMMLSLCILGFSDSIGAFFPFLAPKAISLVILALLTLLAYYSTEFALKSQVFIILLVGISFLLLVKGSYTLPVQETISVHIAPISFWAALSLIYPSLTGIEAGAAMSGDLKRPTRSIAIGTILASLTGFLFYLTVCFLLSKKVPLEFLRIDPAALENVLGNHPLALSGFWAASLASALGCLLSAPRTLRAMSQDGLFPKWISYPAGDMAIPKVATLLTASLAFILIHFGTIQAVVPILTMVLLIIYGMLNLATGIEAIVGNPSWRPTFRMWPHISFFGAFLCLVAMLMMSAGQTFIALFFIICIYYTVKQRGLGSKWDDLRQTILFSLARFSIYRLAYTKPSLRSWRPNFLVLSESGSIKSPLLYWASQMTQGQGFLTLASVMKTGYTELDELDRWERVIYENLKKRKIEALIEMTIAENLADGLKNMITNYGVGSLTPNTVVLGECVREDHFENYIQILQMAASAKRNILVIRGDMENCSRREMDIWWDDNGKSNSEMMILLSQLLLRSPKWRFSRISLKGIASSEKAREQRTAYFEQFCKESRLRATCQVYVADDETNVRKIIANESTKRGIVFYSLSPPESVPDYGAYYLGLMRDLKEIPSICFVMCEQNIDIHKILS